MISSNKGNNGRGGFIIGDYLEHLEKSSKEKEKYICPVCNEPKLSIHKDGLKYNCFSCQDNKQIAYNLMAKAGNLKQQMEYDKNHKPSDKIITHNNDYNLSGNKKQSDKKSKENKTSKDRLSLSQDVLAFLEDKFEGLIEFNLRTNEIELGGQPLRGDYIRPKIAKQYGVDISTNLLVECFAFIASQNQYDPVKLFLARCRHEPSLDINQTVAMLFNTDNELYITYIRKWLIACVARTLEPGCKFDQALVLQGKQGLGKSSFFEIISSEFFSDSMTGNLDTNDLRIMGQNWVLEWAELDGYAARDYHNKIKPFLTRKTDIYRLPYSKDMITVPRRSVIVGTTNRDDFLKDPTGERRFWIVPVKQELNLDLLRAITPGIWSSVISAYEHGESWNLPRELWKAQAEDNEQYRQIDPWESVLIKFLEGKEGLNYSTLELFQELESKGYSLQRSKTDQMRLTDILKQLRWNRKRIYKDTKRIWVWCKE